MELYKSFHGIKLATGGSIRNMQLEVFATHPTDNTANRLYYSEATGCVNFMFKDANGISKRLEIGKTIMDIEELQAIVEDIRQKSLAADITYGNIQTVRDNVVELEASVRANSDSVTQALSETLAAKDATLSSESTVKDLQSDTQVRHNDIVDRHAKILDIQTDVTDSKAAVSASELAVLSSEKNVYDNVVYFDQVYTNMVATHSDMMGIQTDVSGKYDVVNVKYSDIVTMHDTVVLLSDDVSNKHADVVVRSDDVTVKHIDVLANAEQVSTDTETVILAQADVISKHASVTLMSNDVTTKHDNVAIKSSVVDTKHSDVVVRSDDVTVKYNKIQDWHLQVSEWYVGVSMFYSDVSMKHAAVVELEQSATDSKNAASASAASASSSELNVDALHTDVVARHTSISDMYEEIVLASVGSQDDRAYMEGVTATYNIETFMVNAADETVTGSKFFSKPIKTPNVAFTDEPVGLVPEASSIAFRSEGGDGSLSFLDDKSYIRGWLSVPALNGNGKISLSVIPTLDDLDYPIEHVYTTEDVIDLGDMDSSYSDPGGLDPTVPPEVLTVFDGVDFQQMD